MVTDTAPPSEILTIYLCKSLLISLRVTVLLGQLDVPFTLGSQAGSRLCVSGNNEK